MGDEIMIPPYTGYFLNMKSNSQQMYRNFVKIYTHVYTCLQIYDICVYVYIFSKLKYLVLSIPLFAFWSQNYYIVVVVYTEQKIHNVHNATRCGLVSFKSECKLNILTKICRLI